jgi:hypothetical protein
MSSDDQKDEVMRGHPFLNPVEAAIIRWLMKSPRIGLICVKQYETTVTWVLRNENDTVSWGNTESTDVSDDYEPASMKLERIYHLPDAEK